MIKNYSRYFLAFIVACFLTSSIKAHTERLRLACYYYDQDNIHDGPNFIHPGLPWVWGKTKDHQEVYIDGKIEEGFFVVKTKTKKSLSPQEILSDFCINGLQSAFPENYERKVFVKTSVKSSYLALKSYPIVFKGPQKDANRLVIFGDSMSDTGNLKVWIRILPNEPYFAGRFSNGPIWVDYLGINLKFAVQNWALGGLVTKENEFLSNGFFDEIKMAFTSSLEKEIDSYLKKSLKNKRLKDHSETTYFIWAGGNDYLNILSSDKINIFFDYPDDPLFGYFSYIKNVTNNIMSGIKTLYNNGGRNFIISNLPNLGMLPKLKQNDFFHPEETDPQKRIFDLALGMKLATEHHNSSLKNEVDMFAKEHPDTNISFLDIHYAMENMLNGYSLDGTNHYNYNLFLEDYSTIVHQDGQYLAIGKPCFYSEGFIRDRNQVCAEPKKMIFWDYAHPTTFTHCMMGSFINQYSGESSFMPYSSWESYLPSCFLSPLESQNTF